VSQMTTDMLRLS